VQPGYLKTGPNCSRYIGELAAQVAKDPL
jgi:hypothetical protein